MAIFLSYFNMNDVDNKEIRYLMTGMSVWMICRIDFSFYSIVLIFLRLKNLLIFYGVSFVCIGRHLTWFRLIP